MEKVDNTNKETEQTIDYIGNPAYKAMYRRLKNRIDGLIDTLPSQLKEWATSMFVKSVNGKSGSEITISKTDVGLGNVDNTADADKNVAHASTADDADTLDGKQAEDFFLKSEHEEYKDVVDTALADLDSKKVDKEEGKGLSSNDFTTDEKQKLAGIEEGAQVNAPNTVIDANYVHTDNNYTTNDKDKLEGIEAGAQKNTVTSVAGKTGDVVLEKGDVGLGNVDNTADADKNVAHAATADDSDTLDGKHADDFLLKTEHEAYAESVSAAITSLETNKADKDALTNLDERKVDKVAGKDLSTNDYTDVDKQKLEGIEAGAQKNATNTVVDANYVHTDNNYTTDEKNKLAGIEEGAQKNTVTSVAGRTGDVTINKDDVGGLQTALDGKQDNLPFTSAPSDSNKVVTQNELNTVSSAASNAQSKANAAQSSADTAKQSAEIASATAIYAQESAEYAKNAAIKAQSSADNAAASADTANSLLESLGLVVVDGKICQKFNV